jgi:hypothetical protein
VKVTVAVAEAELLPDAEAEPLAEAEAELEAEAEAEPLAEAEAEALALVEGVATAVAVVVAVTVVWAWTPTRRAAPPAMILEKCILTDRVSVREVGSERMEIVDVVEASD